MYKKTNNSGVARSSQPTSYSTVDSNESSGEQRAQRRRKSVSLRSDPHPQESRTRTPRSPRKGFTATPRPYASGQPASLRSTSSNTLSPRDWNLQSKRVTWAGTLTSRDQSDAVILEASVSTVGALTRTDSSSGTPRYSSGMARGPEVPLVESPRPDGGGSRLDIYTPRGDSPISGAVRHPDPDSESDSGQENT